MAESSNEQDEMTTVTNVMERLWKSDTGRGGLVLVVIALIGLIVIFSMSWMKSDDFEGEGFSYKYGDFGHEFEEDWGEDMDGYFHGNARLSFFGFFLLLIAGVLLLLQAYNGMVYTLISPHIPSSLRSNPDHPEFLKILLSLILLFITVIIIIAGTRFIGFTHAFKESISQGEDIDFQSPAGWTVFILGLILLGLELYYLHTKLTDRILGDSVKYRKGVQKCIALMAFVSIVGLITFSLLPILKIEIVDEEEENGEIGEAVMNDGYLHVISEIEDEGDWQTLDSDLGRMRACLWGCFLISIITFIGLIYLHYANDDMTARFHYIVSFGALVFIIAIFFLIFHLMFFSHMSDFELGESEVEGDASFGSNIIPLLCGIGLLGLGILYVKETYPLSISRTMEYLKIPNE